jgi:hypothetical protein
VCSTKGMIDVALSLFALIAGGVTLELFTTRAPSSTQDEHLGSDSIMTAEEFQIGNPS